MAQHGALIAGSFATQFFDNVLWKESDLDIYIQDGEGAAAFANHLRLTEEYTLEKSTITHGSYEFTAKVCPPRTFF
jgi:hypothetical protein